MLTSQERINKNERTKKYNKKRRQTDMNFRILGSLRSRIRLSLKGKTKSKYTLELIGCSIEFLKQWLENKFIEGMNWNNYGFGKNKWNIDHIKPCSKFDLTDIEQQKQCFHYSNLQQLWHIDNLKKNNKYD